MKNVPAVQAAIEDASAVKALPELIIDWNMNRYVGGVADNTPAEIDSAFDAEMFPIESIIEPNRPTKGINKARVGSGTIGDDYLIGGAATPNGRFYIADVTDVYKYWTSQTPSDAVTGLIANCKPKVIYTATTAVNKIVITLENTWASPKTFNIQTTTSATPNDTTDWTTIATQTTTPNGWKGTGQIVLYWNGTTWTNAARSDNADKSPKTTSIRGVRMVVTELEGGYKVTPDGSAVASTYGTYVNGVYTTLNTDGKDARFDLIEISARLEVDLTPYVIDVEDTFDMGDPDNLYPIGTVTSNQGGIALSNLYTNGGITLPGLFNADNAASPYKNYIEPNAEVTLRYKYYNIDTNALVGTVQQFKLYTETWNGQSEDIVNVDLTDQSKFFNETTVRSAMWEGLTVPEIIWRVLDSVGFVNYYIDTDANRVTEHTIPVFYTDGEKSVWEVLDELAKASQTAIYFDGNGVLRVKTRDFAMSATDAAVWNFTSVADGNQLANIIDLEQTTEFEPNHYKVIYQSTNWAPVERQQPTLQKVWEPESTQVLRATQLVRSMTTSSMTLWLGSSDVRLWPYEGLVNVEGELMRYSGKEYVYYTGTSGQTRNVKIIHNADEHKSRNAETTWNFKHANHYTGALVITERGVWNSEPVAHDVDAKADGVKYSARHIVNGTRRTGVAGFRHLKQESRVRLAKTKRFKDYKDLLVVTQGDTDDTPFYHYGTKMKFIKGSSQQTAGLLIHNSGTDEDGYYVELTPTRRLGGKERKNRHELIVYSRVNGKDKRIGGRGRALAIGEGIWYEMDITYRPSGSDHRIQVWINGKNVFNETIAGANKNAANGRFGMFMRGRTKADYEYLYAIKRQEPEPPDDFSFLDKVERGYTGQMWDREWVYQWKNNTRRVKKKTNDPKHRINQMFMDEFGPYAHEIREYDIKFEPSPVLHSRLYLTNDWSAVALEYSATPFGAKFILANTARNNAVIHGEDTLSYSGTNSSVNQVLTVFGRALVIEEAEEVIAKNDDQIRRRGKTEAELSSQWIQSKDMAQEVADWMNDHFSYGNDEISVRVFGNPLIEVGDVVHVTYPAKHINSDYFVVGTSNNFENGIVTNLTLRRRYS